MSEVKTGISKAIFVAGLIVAILASTLIASFVSMQYARGPKGDKGDIGPIGSTGPQGPVGPATVFAKWDVHWYTVTGDLQWGGEVGTSEFCSTFNYDWGTGPVSMGYGNYIGFQANMQIKMQRSGPVTFTIGSDDGARLFIDGYLWLDNWRSGYYQTKSVTISPLASGYHTLTLWYLEQTYTARVSFDCDSDVLMWNP